MQNSYYTIPYVTEETPRGSSSTDIYSRLLKDRIIFIGNDIDDQIANSVIAQLLFLKTNDPKKDIHIYIHAKGGSLYAVLAIYDTMVLTGCDINTYGIGMSASTPTMLVASGTKGKRFALKHSRFMLHQPYGGVTGTSADIEIQAEELLRLKSTSAGILSEKTGQPLEKIIKDSERDYYMSATEAMQYGSYGLIDHILGENA